MIAKQQEVCRMHFIATCDTGSISAAHNFHVGSVPGAASCEGANMGPGLVRHPPVIQGELICQYAGPEICVVLTASYNDTDAHCLVRPTTTCHVGMHNPWSEQPCSSMNAREYVERCGVPKHDVLKEVSY